MCFRCKFRIVIRISNPAFSTEDFEITHIGFLVSEEFIGSLPEEFLKIYSVDDVARSINCINPETIRCFVLIEHSASHLSKSPVFALHDAILLRSIKSRYLMSNPKFIKIVIETRILELSAIVTSDVLNLH